LIHDGKMIESKMKTGPRPKRRSWTPEVDEQLLALVAAKMDTASIARKLQRTESATDTRKSKLKGEEVTVPNQLERQLMQELRDAGWVKAAALPPFPKTIEGLLSKGWIERRGGGNDTCYRLTDEGLAAKMAPLRIYD
jgi:hypothetical protein